MYWNGKISIYLGCDPEVFVQTEALLPAYIFLPPKAEKKRFDGKHHHANVFWDGFQAEFDLPPSSCIAYIVDGIREGLRGVRELARENNPTARLSSQNVFQIPIKTLRTEREEFVMLGCNPSQNVYGMLGEGVFDARKLRYRFAGGHIHLGISEYKYTQKQIESLVRLLDATLGIWSVGAAANFDNPIRRKYYGLAGGYRLPEHGLEYRTLSNFWLTHPGLSNLVLMFARTVFSFHHAGLEKEWLSHPQEVIETINHCDVKAARKILELNHNILGEIFGHLQYDFPVADWKTDPGVQQALRIGHEGLESVVDDPNDFVKNWKLNKRWQGHCDGDLESWKDLCQAKIQIAA